jgi:hypothetical protein
MTTCEVWTWEFLCMPSLNGLLTTWVDGEYHNNELHLITRRLPADRPPFSLTRTQIMEVYYLLEVDWNEGGWLHERPSNVQRGRARGRVGESTDVQIRDIVTRKGPTYPPTITQQLTWNRLTLNQKWLYCFLARKWGLVHEESM